MCYLLCFFKKEVLSLLRGSNPQAMPAVGSGGALAILANHEQRKTKYFIIMNMVPLVESNHHDACQTRKGGLFVFTKRNALYSIATDVIVADPAQH